MSLNIKSWDEARLRVLLASQVSTRVTRQNSNLFYRVIKTVVKINLLIQTVNSYQFIFIVTAIIDRIFPHFMYIQFIYTFIFRFVLLRVGLTFLCSLNLKNGNPLKQRDKDCCASNTYAVSDVCFIKMILKYLELSIFF